MLQHLRDNSRGVISFILIGFLVIIFALTGVEALFNWDSSANQAAKVNGETITEMDVARAIGMQKQQMLNAYGDQIPPEFLSDEYLRKPVIDNLVQREVLSQAAEDSGLTVGQSLISEQIASAPQFKNDSGTFDNNRYQQVLRNMGYTHSTYTKILSDEIVINQLRTGVSATAFTTPAQLEEIVALSFQSRDLAYAILPAAKLRDSIQIDATDIQSYYDKNQQMFTSEELIAVDYISLSVPELMKSISVSEEQVRKQFEQNQSAFVAAPERQAAHILVENNDAEKVGVIAAKLAEGEDFATLAKEFSDDLGSKEQGGDLGFSKGDAFPAEFEAALSALKVGEVSAATKTDAGTHFIKLLSEKGAEPPSFDEQKASIEEQLKRAEAEHLFVTQLEKLREESYNADNLNEVAQLLNLKAENSGLFERTKGQGLMGNPKVISAAFSADVLEDGNSSEVIEIDSNTAVVLKKTDHKPSQVKPIADVQEQITSILKDQKAKTLLDEKAAELIAKLKAGGDFTELSKVADIELKQFTAATRNSTDVDPDVLSYAFTMSKPSPGAQSFDKVMTANGDMAVVALTAVTPGNYTNVTPEQKAAIPTQLASIYGSNDFSSYQRFLKETADIVEK